MRLVFFTLLDGIDAPPRIDTPHGIDPQFWLLAYAYHEWPPE
jgi:hypothetical protein